MNKILFLHGWFSDGSSKTFFLMSQGYKVLTPRLGNFSYKNSIKIAQKAYEEFNPDLIIGSSRGGSVALDLNVNQNVPLILLAPAYKFFRKSSDTNHKNIIVLHSKTDDLIPFKDSVEFCDKNNVKLYQAGVDHQLNCNSAKKCLKEILNKLQKPFN